MLSYGIFEYLVDFNKYYWSLLFYVRDFFLIYLDRIKEFKKLNYLIFINFLELLDIFIKSFLFFKVNYLDRK